ncbi:hypothetical protein NE237_010320 [Protea cynaroides]|uniref:Uncharacterized protein n=1 Tax=Protea cynaroides TaxID=273540 RepID=A0A9Q0R137_9MAGN|nr:hypothetical protein NE237_010320 [Protea cynaroides]
MWASSSKCKGRSPSLSIVVDDSLCMAHANFLCDILAKVDSLEAKCSRAELRWEIAKDALARRYRQRMMTLESEQAKHLAEKTKLSMEFFALCDFVLAKIPNFDFSDFQGVPSSPSDSGIQKRNWELFFFFFFVNQALCSHFLFL